MLIKSLVKKRKYAVVSKKEFKDEKPNIPNGMWRKCPNCGEFIYNEFLEKNLMVCSNCNHHFRLTAYERINYTLDEGSFKEIKCDAIQRNPLNFAGYNEKHKFNQEGAGIDEAVIIGTGNIVDKEVVIAVMESNFMMGSMGTVVGERITTAVEYATKNRLPIIIFTTSGGARMQEGMFSLMQMAKISAAIAKHSESGLLYITVLTDPTTGGVTASFAMQGDIILSEPNALVGFAGRRVIENTINEKLPEDFQKAEFLLERGFIDKIVSRERMKEVLSKLLVFHEVKI